MSGPDTDCQPIFGPAGDQDADVAYLFLCLENGHYAVSRDRDGRNLPQAACAAGWEYVRSFALGVRESLPLEADPEPVLRALRDPGYYIWTGSSLPHGTGQ